MFFFLLISVESVVMSFLSFLILLFVLSLFIIWLVLQGPWKLFYYSFCLWSFYLFPICLFYWFPHSCLFFLSSVYFGFNMLCFSNFLSWKLRIFYLEIFLLIYPLHIIIISINITLTGFYMFCFNLHSVLNIFFFPM